MLGKCANPVCLASFRRLGTGKLFAFEMGMNASSTEIASNPVSTKTGQTPVFFWLCETCSLIFTLGLDAAGELTLHGIRDDVRVPIIARRRLDQAG